ncbi:MAG: helix-turn-helix domain-containing protein [Ruminococcaceae bacterium]|nr:helix-turn-helix domain-containing protein [Oscillospiraceae bacterium]
MEKQQLVEIGQRLRQRRQELGLTRDKMSELADIGSGYYGQLEVGTSQMSVDTLAKLSRSMHLPMEYILFGDGYEPGDSSAVIELLHRCTPRELALAEEILKLFLMKV